MFYRLDAFALALSQHYRVLKEVVMDSSVPRLMSSEDARSADAIADIIENIGGRGLANYCRLKFQEAWLSWDVKVYDVRGMLEFILDNCTECQFKDQLRARFESLVDLVFRLSNPLHRKYRTKTQKTRRDGQEHAEQMLLFPELEPPKQEEPKEEPKKEEKPKRAAKPRPRRRSRLDKLADEIIGAEYGLLVGQPMEDDPEDQEDPVDPPEPDEPDEPDAQGDDDEDEDDRPARNDACEHYSRGYSRFSDRDFGYFSGNCDD